jgi:hypothetical protein
MKVAGREPRVRRLAGWQAGKNARTVNGPVHGRKWHTGARQWGQAAAALTKGGKDHHNERRRWKRERPCTRVS